MTIGTTKPTPAGAAVVGTQSLDRGLALLMLIADSPSPGLTLAMCTSELGLSKATTQRMLQTLVHRELLELDQETGRYMLGPTTIRLGASYLRRIDVRSRALPHMRAVVAQTKETAHLGVLRRTEVIYLELVESNVPVRIFSQIGDSVPAYATATGKAILAWLPHQEVLAHLPKRLIARTPRTITSVERLLDELSLTRERGYAVDVMENRQDVHGFAAPIFDHRDEVIAAVAVAAPDDRITPELKGAMSREIVRAAKLISLEMGASVARTQ